MVGPYRLEAQKFQEVLKVISQKMNLVAVLPNKLKKNSGLQYTQNALWTFNDSGENAELYKLNKPSGNIIQSVHLINAKNKDFDNIACDGRYLYVVDKEK